MDLKQIQELVKLVNKSGISELQVKEGDFEVTIKTGATVQPVQYAPAYTQQSPMAAQQQAAEAKAEAPAQAAATAPKADSGTAFKSPMIGTFYRKSGPDKDPFVKVGDNIKRGDVLCIIEAMKLFNEIEYDGDGGKVVKILVDDASPVEYDQPLFLIEKA
ncbi:MAG: acetyl-CoA carboxylase biotin carboxyl carrier protein [Bacteroidetes bacterium]|nr:acetyl-CoA carboxylase biotin carboxyl carrier protein [Bacteroidota bacterium]